MSIFNKAKILVIGDAMLDKYSFGSTNRISPEAPVPVLKVERETLKWGRWKTMYEGESDYCGQIGRAHV